MCLHGTADGSLHPAIWLSTPPPDTYQTPQNAIADYFYSDFPAV
jgi:hypothetical protein